MMKRRSECEKMKEYMQKPDRSYSIRSFMYMVSRLQICAYTGTTG